MAEFYVDSTIYKGRPADAQNRLSKELAVYDLLDKLEIPYERADHETANTIADCENIENVLGTSICKNLFLRNRQGTDFYLLLMPGDKNFRTSTVSKLLGVARLSFAEPELLMEYLSLTPGSVTVLSLMNDPEHKVRLVIDSDVLKEEYFGCHPCINTSTLKIKTKDILDVFIPYCGHEPVILDIPAPEMN